MSNEKKKSFIMYFDKRPMLDELLKQDGCDTLSYERVGKLFIALCDFAEFGTTDVVMDSITRLAYTVLTPRMKDDKEKYDKTCEIRRESGRKGGLSKANASNCYQLLPIASNTYQTLATSSDTDTDTVTDTVTDTDISISETKRKRFSPPTLEEVKAYCLERGNKVDAERFIDYYTSNGWKVGKNSMKDWKSAVKLWERNEYTKGGVTDDKYMGNDSRGSKDEGENGTGTWV